MSRNPAAGGLSGTGTERAISLHAMKILGLALGLTSTILFGSLAVAADLPEDEFYQASTLRNSENPASELRNQDKAFSLLIEAYRQVQGYIIESDYDARLQAIAGLTDPKAHRQALVLAKQERDLRRQKLYGQMGKLNTAYSTARDVDVREVGLNVPSEVDPIAASKQLQTFVFIAPATDDASDFKTTKSIPVSEILGKQARLR